MKRKYILGLLLIMFYLTGCGQKSNIMDGVELTFDKEYKDMYISYKYPSEFVEKDGPRAYPLDKQNLYEFYNNDKLTFILKVEEYNLSQSFTNMEKDAEALENNKNFKDISKKNVKANGRSLVRYSYRTKDEFGDDTLYYVYYGGYSYLGTYEYIKVTFVNVEGREKFEKEFLRDFKIYSK